MSTKKKRRQERKKWRKAGEEETGRRMEKGDRERERRLSFGCGHGPSGRTIFYRIYLSRVLCSMKESLARKLPGPFD